MKKESPAKIFIVEDEPFFANLINYDLEANYYDGIKIYFSGEEAIANLHLKPRVVILDHQLPGMSGLEVLDKIKDVDPDIHVIFLSGTGPAIAISAYKLGATDFIVKDENAFNEVRNLLKKIFQEEKA
jgi:DNA-binding NtrC family response regulator